MASSNEHQPDAAPEALLRSARPASSMPFAANLERDLFPEKAQVAQRSTRFGVLAGAAGGLAVVLVIAGLAGGGPLISGGSDAAKAKPGCTTMYVTRVEPVGGVVRKADGTVTVETARKPITREQQRCR